MKEQGIDYMKGMVMRWSSISLLEYDRVSRSTPSISSAVDFGSLAKIPRLHIEGVDVKVRDEYVPRGMFERLASRLSTPAPPPCTASSPLPAGITNASSLPPTRRSRSD